MGVHTHQHTVETRGSQLVDEDEETDSFSQGKSFPEPMEEHTDTLLDIHAKMTKIVEKLGQITKNLRGISELEWNQNDKSFCSEPLFGTWHTNEFYEASDKLVAMYKKELALKLTIVQNIAHTTDQDLARTMVYAWTHEPYIDERATMILETLFLETGLRK